MQRVAFVYQMSKIPDEDLCISICHDYMYEDCIHDNMLNNFLRFSMQHYFLLCLKLQKQSKLFYSHDDTTNACVFDQYI